MFTYTKAIPKLSSLFTQSRSITQQSTLTEIYRSYRDGSKISLITAHDHITACIADNSNADMVLIGDSLAMTSHGYPSTLQIHTDDFIYAARSVVSGINSKFLICDLPFGSFEGSSTLCAETATRLMRLGKINSLKLEGADSLIIDRINLLTSMGIPVTGHLGLQPQKFNLLGGYKVQGRSSDSAIELFKDAQLLQKAGCKLLVLECVPEKVAKFITENLNIPTIGIGSGKFTSGQVLVIADALGMQNKKPAKFVKQYANIYNDALKAVNQYDSEVKSGAFPVSGEHTYKMNDQQFSEFQERAESGE